MSEHEVNKTKLGKAGCFVIEVYCKDERHDKKEQNCSQKEGIGLCYTGPYLAIIFPSKDQDQPNCQADDCGFQLSNYNSF